MGHLLPQVPGVAVREPCARLGIRCLHLKFSSTLSIALMMPAAPSEVTRSEIASSKKRLFGECDGRMFYGGSSPANLRFHHRQYDIASDHIIVRARAAGVSTSSSSRTRSTLWWRSAWRRWRRVRVGGTLYYNLNLGWIDGGEDHVGVIPAANTISEKAAWARKQLHDYCVPGGGTGPWWSSRAREEGMPTVIF